MSLRNYTTIVSGLPRSGTSLMMNMLEAGGIPALTDGIRIADDDNPKGYYEYEPVKKTKEDPSWLNCAAGKAVKMVYLLLYDLPDQFEYRVVFMKRRILEVVESQNKMLRRKGIASNVEDNDQTIEFLQKSLNHVRQWLQKKHNWNVLEVDYNRLLDKPEPEIDQISEFLDGNLNIEAMIQVIDPALYRNQF